MNKKAKAQQTGSPRLIPGAAQRHLPTGVRFLEPEQAVFNAMLDGWAKQMKSRSLTTGTIEDRLRQVRRFAAFTNEYPWNWCPVDLEEWSSFLRSGEKPVAHSTLRGYQQDIAIFMVYLTDSQYGWGDECERRFGTFPIQICHEWNMVSHRDLYEGQPRVRPFSRSELQDFFDFCDEKVVMARKLGRKGWLAAFRDATIFKVIYGCGLRRAEAAKLDLVDFGPNSVATKFGSYGMLAVRWGKSMAGSPPKRRNVLTVWKWAAESVEEYVQEIRPLYDHSQANARRGGSQELDKAMWPTERGGRVSPDYLSMRFASYREELGLPEELHPHCLRHSYITHLIEDGWDQYFVQQQVGHNWGSTTSLYVGVSNDYRNETLRQALSPIFDEPQDSTASVSPDKAISNDHGPNNDADSSGRAR